MRAENYGGIGPAFVSFMFGLSAETLSNYIRPVAWALYRSLKDIQFAFLQWPLATVKKQTGYLLIIWQII